MESSFDVECSQLHPFFAAGFLEMAAALLLVYIKKGLTAIGKTLFFLLRFL